MLKNAESLSKLDVNTASSANPRHNDESEPSQVMRLAIDMTEQIQQIRVEHAQITYRISRETSKTASKAGNAISRIQQRANEFVNAIDEFSNNLTS